MPPNSDRDVDPEPSGEI